MKSLAFHIIISYTIIKKGVIGMANVNINFRLDEDTKKTMEAACADMGLTLTAAFTIFAKAVCRERRIPFEVTADPFYSAANMSYLEKKAADYRAGNLKLAEHDLIED